MDSIYKASKYKNRPKENYHDEGFMDELIAKIKQREEARKRLRDSTAFETKDSPTKPSNGYVLPPRVCVDYRYLKDKES